MLYGHHYHGRFPWSTCLVVYDDRRTIFRNCVTRKSWCLLSIIYQANPLGQTWLFRFALSSTDRSPGAISCFVVFVSRSFLRGWRPNDTLFEQNFCLDTYAFYHSSITFEKGGGSWESFLRTTLLYYRDKFIEKINFAFHNFFHLVEYNKYAYRRDITMSIYVNVGNIR